MSTPKFEAESFYCSILNKNVTITKRFSTLQTDKGIDKRHVSTDCSDMLSCGKRLGTPPCPYSE